MLGDIEPGVFISMAEESGLILPLGKWIMEEACHQMKKWNTDFGGTPKTICVNISPAQYCQDDLVAQVRLVLQQTGLVPSCLALEVTENLAMQNVDQAAACLCEI